MKKLIYALITLLIAGGVYWAVSEYCLDKEPTIKADSVEVVEIAIDKTNVELNTLETNE